MFCQKKRERERRIYMKYLIFKDVCYLYRMSFSTCKTKFGYIFQSIICRHGIIQFLTPWSDGPEFVTQCPIPSGSRYTYKFNLTGQEGTLWWHAHSSFLRATVYGALLIRPRVGHSYPFPKVYQEVPILLGNFPHIFLYLLVI